jgi:hypothetical protein
MTAIGAKRTSMDPDNVVGSLVRTVALGFGGAGGIRTLDTAFQPYNGLANRRLQPLGHSTIQFFRRATDGRPLWLPAVSGRQPRGHEPFPRHGKGALLP